MPLAVMPSRDLAHAVLCHPLEWQWPATIRYSRAAAGDVRRNVSVSAVSIALFDTTIFVEIRAATVIQDVFLWGFSGIDFLVLILQQKQMRVRERNSIKRAEPYIVILYCFGCLLS